MRRAILLALLGLLAIPCAAAAFTPTPGLERYERAAKGFWETTPDCARVEYLWPQTDPWPSGADDPSTPQDERLERAAGYAELGGCRVWLIRDEWSSLAGGGWLAYEGFIANCTTVVHEWGHLLGLDHDPEGDMRMAGLAKSIAAHCRRAAGRLFPRVARMDFDSDRFDVRQLTRRRTPRGARR